MRQLRQSVSGLVSFITNHLQYHHADDVRMVNSVSIHFDSLVSRLVHQTVDVAERYHLLRSSRLVTYKECQCNSEDTEVLLATDLSKLLADIKTAAQVISLAT